MKLEKECYIYEIQHWTNMPKKFGVDVSMTIKDLLNEKEMNILNTIIKKNKIKLTLEVEEPILDDVEKEYLSGVIRPFRDRIEFIRKSCIFEQEYINVVYNSKFKDDTNFCLPLFEKGTMYKNMTLNKEYSLEDLGL